MTITDAILLVIMGMSIMATFVAITYIVVKKYENNKVNT